MDAKYIKEFIYDNNCVALVLEELGMHHLRWHGSRKYLTCAMPDGDNPTSTTVYNNEHLNVVAYTRNIEDSFGASDIISLVCFVKKMYFSHALKWLCNLVGLDYYHNIEEDLPESIRWTRMLLKMQSLSGEEDDESTILKPIDEHILSYYHQKPILQWVQHEGIFTDTQVEFEIGFDLRSERITIPIRDEIGNLVGVKGRLYLRESNDKLPKYLYLEQCAKSQILYGLHKTYEFIKQDGFVVICESEKGVLQLWSHGYKNVVSIGGHKFSKAQVEKITRLNVDVVVAFDKGITEADVLHECDKFMDCINTYYLIDKDDLLEEKDSPMDDFDKFQMLMENNKYLFIRG